MTAANAALHLHARARAALPPPAPPRSKGLRIPAPWPALEPGPDAEAAVRGMRQALVGMGLEDLPLDAPRIVVPPPEAD